MSCCACLFAFLVSTPTFAVGFKFVMACPKLIDLVYRDLLVVLVGHEVPWGTAWPKHGGFHAGEGYVQVVAYVGSSHALSQVLEWGTDLLCRRVLHPRERLDLLRELAVWRQAGRLVLGCAERAAVAHSVIARAHAAACVPVLRKS